MTDPLDLARRLYAGFLAHDAEAIRGVLHADFTGRVSAGMPLGVGGRHDGPDAMLRDVWAPVFMAYDVRVEADDLLSSGDVVVAVGGYRGVERAAQQSFDAAFAHILTFRDGLIDGLTQITDTASWPVPPATAEAP